MPSVASRHLAFLLTAFILGDRKRSSFTKAKKPRRNKPEPKRCALIFCAALMITLGLSANRSGNVQSKISLPIESGRPVADGVRALESACGCAITYEDPLYVHPSEINDVTESVRRDLDKYPPGKAPRVLVPKGGSLNLEYDPALLKSDPARVVRDLVAANASQRNPGRFRVLKDGQIIHVIPTAFKNRKGVLTRQASVLDAVISPPSLTKSLYQMLREICAEISKATNTHIVVGGFPLNGLVSYRQSLPSKPLRARDLLTRLLGPRQSWQLFYGPGERMYALNIHSVR